MSRHELSAWASFGVTLVAFVPYFLHVSRQFARGELKTESIAGPVIGAIVLQMMLQVAVHLGIGLLSKREPKTEHDVAIEATSVRIAYGLLGCLGFIAIAGVMVLTMFPAPSWMEQMLTPLVVSQVFLFCLVIADAAKFLSRAVSYRRADSQS